MSDRDGIEPPERSSNHRRTLPRSPGSCTPITSGPRPDGERRRSCPTADDCRTTTDDKRQAQRPPVAVAQARPLLHAVHRQREGKSPREPQPSPRCGAVETRRSQRRTAPPADGALGTKLLGLVKHLASIQFGWLCERFGRPSEWIAWDPNDCDGDARVPIGRRRSSAPSGTRLARQGGRPVSVGRRV
jgi:hypothetical protein